MHLQKCFKKDKNVIKKIQILRFLLIYIKWNCLPSSVNLKKTTCIHY